MLKIRIHDDHRVSLRMVQAGGESRFLPEVAAQANRTATDVAKHVPRVVRRSVIDKNDVVCVIGDRHRRCDSGDEIRNVFGFPKDGYHERYMAHLTTRLLSDRE